MDSIVQLISNVGYPIAMSLILLWYINTKEEKQNNLLLEVKEVLIVIKNYIEKGER